VNAEHPSEAKRLGRLARDFDQDRWDRYADRIVEEGDRYNFGDERNKDPKEVLLTTGGRIIVEASPDDRIWGSGFDAIVAECQEDHWGNNGMGKALTKVRNRLRNEERAIGRLPSWSKLRGPAAIVLALTPERKQFGGWLVLWYGMGGSPCTTIAPWKYHLRNTRYEM
jgi:hypothetical protein